MPLPIIELWLYKDDFAPLDPLIRDLGSAQHQRALELKNQRQREFVIGRSLLALAIKKNTDSQDWQIRERSQSSPIVDHPSQQFVSNISHSKDWVALAFCENRQASQMLLGLDIEFVKQRQQFEAAKYFCNTSQLQELNSAQTNENKSRYFSLLWTQKEAYFKARQQTIWNPRIKSIAFENNKSTTLHAQMQSAYYEQSLALSVYCNSGCELTTLRIRTLQEKGALAAEPLKIDWQPYSIKDSN